MSERKDSIQSKIRRLESIIEWFESDNIDVDEALQKYEEGMKLVGALQKDMKNVKNKFTRLQKSFEQKN